MNQAAVGKDFILAGRAILTMVGKASRFTFKVRRADPSERYPNPQLYFVSVMTGTDNETSYSYIGTLDPRSGEVRQTRNSKVPAEHPAVQAATWAFPKVFQTGTLPGGQLMHAGRCGRCGRLLTDPDSIRTGFGPECRDRLGIPVRPEEVAGDL